MAQNRIIAKLRTTEAVARSQAAADFLQAAGGDVMAAVKTVYSLVYLGITPAEAEMLEVLIYQHAEEKVAS